MTTYFGLCDSAGNASEANSDNNNVAIISWNDTVTFTCPGSGSQNVAELTADVHLTSGAPKVRHAIYSSDGATLIGQGTAAVSASSGSDAWKGHIGAANISPNPCTLTGGVAYKLVCGQDAGGTLNTDHCRSGGGAYKFVDKVTAGYSGALPSPDGTNSLIWPVRCGVDQAPLTLEISVAECISGTAIN